MDPSTACAASPSGWAPVMRKLPAMRNMAIQTASVRKDRRDEVCLPPTSLQVSRRLPLAVYNRWATDRLPHVYAAAKRQRHQTSANKQFMGICTAGHRSGSHTQWHRTSPLPNLPGGR